jgi:TatD DNase family protein
MKRYHVQKTARKRGYMIFDTHAHYDDESFDEDREELIFSLKNKGVGTVVNVGASVASTKKTFEIVKKYDFMYGAVGIHPEDVERLDESHMEWLKSLAADKKIVAIGEIGLDYHYDEPEREVQKKWFARQLDLAYELDMPIIIHSRDAAADTLDIMKAHHGDELNGVIHCFSYSPEMAQIYLDMGYYLGIGGVVTFKNSKKLKEVVKMTPLERIVLETDCPYLTPEPHRGKRNDSSYLKYVVECISKLKGISAEKIIKTTCENAVKMYRIR